MSNHGANEGEIETETEKYHFIIGSIWQLLSSSKFGLKLESGLELAPLVGFFE